MFRRLLVPLFIATGLGLAVASPAVAWIGDGSLAARMSFAEKSPIQEAQFVYGGRNFCWYDSGWKGAGWYWCGYAWRSGYGWGGGYGWNSWRHAGYGYHGAYRPGYRPGHVGGIHRPGHVGSINRPGHHGGGALRGGGGHRGGGGGGHRRR